MKREHSLRRRLRALQTMSDAVSALKSLSAHHLRLARNVLGAAREYRAQTQLALAAAQFPRGEATDGSAGLLLLAADLGMCGSYTLRLTKTAQARYQAVPQPRFYCVGQRPVPQLKRLGVTVDRTYHAPASVAGLAELLLKLAQDLLDEYLSGRIVSLDVISARFEGVGEFTPVCQRLLPITTPPGPATVPVSSYVSHEHFQAVVLREVLYSQLYEILLDALASEHGARLVATESAGEWLSDRILQTQQQLNMCRREASTQEVLDIASGARLRKKPT